MKILLDTRVLLWAAGNSDELPERARALIEDADNEVVFSAASLWEIAAKIELGRPDFRVDLKRLRRGLLDNNYVELAVTGRHAVALAALPALHADPIDRMLIAQATVDGLVLLTVDPLVARYPGPVKMI
jgi:PIN domain nuclease of toxin-antitoxin system